MIILQLHLMLNIKGGETKILTPKQMFQRLPTTLRQVKASNTPY